MLEYIIIIMEANNFWPLNEKSSCVKHSYLASRNCKLSQKWGYLEKEGWTGLTPFFLLHIHIWHILPFLKLIIISLASSAVSRVTHPLSILSCVLIRTPSPRSPFIFLSILHQDVSSRAVIKSILFRTVSLNVFVRISPSPHYSTTWTIRGLKGKKFVGI